MSDRQWRIIVLILCFTVTLLNYLDRGLISFAVQGIEDDFGIEDAMFGWLTSAFALGTLSSNFIAGALVDRFGVHGVWTFAIFVWSLAMVLLGVVHNLAVFMVLRVILDLAEGVSFMAMNRGLANWMLPAQLSAAVGVCLVGVPLALLLAGPLLSHLINAAGWRWAFIILGIGSAVAGTVFGAVYRDPTARLSFADREHLDWRSVRNVMTNVTLLATAWSFFAFGWVLFFGITWLPGYLEQQVGLDVEHVGLLSTVPWASACLLIPIVGVASDRIMSFSMSTRVARVHLIWPLQLASLLAFVPLSFQETSTESAVTCLTLGLSLSMAPNALYYSIVTDMFPSERTGLATGLVVTFFSAAGVVCPYSTGVLAEYGGGFGPAFGVLCGVVATAVLGLLIFARPPVICNTIPNIRS